MRTKTVIEFIPEVGDKVYLHDLPGFVVTITEIKKEKFTSLGGRDLGMKTVIYTDSTDSGGCMKRIEPCQIQWDGLKRQWEYLC